MLYFDHWMYMVCEDALHIVRVAHQIQVLLKANKILVQCAVHKPVFHAKLRNFPQKPKKEIPGIRQTGKKRNKTK